jgi:hypothetical protein
VVAEANRFGLCRSEEFEAEAVAWIVGARQGLDPGSYRYLEGFLGTNRNVPDVSLHQIMVAANHIEMLASITWRPRRVDNRRSTTGTLTGLVSANSGQAYRDDDE